MRPQTTVIVILGAFLCGALLGPSPAEAKDLSGRIGVGAESPLVLNAGSLAPGPVLTRIPGGSFRYQLSELIGLQVLLSARYGSSSPEDSEDSTSALLFGGSFRGHFTAIGGDDVNLGVVVGATVASVGIDVETMGTTTESSVFLVGFEAGLRPEWFATNWLSFHTQVGFSYGIIQTDAAGMEQDSTLLGLGNSVDLFGNAGFTFWFGGTEGWEEDEPVGDEPVPEGEPWPY